MPAHHLPAEPHPFGAPAPRPPAWLDDALNPRITRAGDRMYPTERAFLAFSLYRPMLDVARVACAPTGVLLEVRREMLAEVARRADAEVTSWRLDPLTGERFVLVHKAAARVIADAGGSADALAEELVRAVVAAVIPEAGVRAARSATEATQAVAS